MPTPAQNRAHSKWRSKSCDQINIQIPKGTRDKYRAQAAARGLSLNAYIVALMDADSLHDETAIIPNPRMAD